MKKKNPTGLLTMSSTQCMHGYPLPRSFFRRKGTAIYFHGLILIQINFILFFVHFLKHLIISLKYEGEYKKNEENVAAYHIFFIKITTYRLIYAITLL